MLRVTLQKHATKSATHLRQYIAGGKVPSWPAIAQKFLDVG